MRYRRVVAERVVRRLGIASLGVGPTTVRVPSTARLRWAPNWKADVLHRLDVAGRGLLDVGANRGQTLLDFLAAGGRGPYVGIEPLPEAAAVVQRVIELNDLADAVVVTTALGAAPSAQLIHVPLGDDTSASMRADLRPGRVSRRRVVPVNPFDHLRPLLGEMAPGVVKIDVEGFELEALRGMGEYLSTCRPAILCEVLDADLAADADLHDDRLRQLESLLTSHAYGIARVDKPLGQVTGTTDLGSFPRRRWSQLTAEECDYLLLPRR